MNIALSKGILVLPWFKKLFNFQIQNGLCFHFGSTSGIHFNFLEQLSNFYQINSGNLKMEEFFLTI